MTQADHFTDSSDEKLMWSRILVLHSRRLLLANAERRLRRQPSEDLAVQRERLRLAVMTADDACRAALHKTGPPRISAHWRKSFSQLVDRAGAAVRRLRELPDATTPVELRFELSTDIEQLEKLVEEWRALIRPPPSTEVKSELGL